MTVKAAVDTVGPILTIIVYSTWHKFTWGVSKSSLPFRWLIIWMRRDTHRGWI